MCREIPLDKVVFMRDDKGTGTSSNVETGVADCVWERDKECLAGWMNEAERSVGG